RLKSVLLDSAAIRRQVVSASAPEAQRLEALEALIAFKEPGLLDVLQELWNATPSDGERVQGAGIRFKSKVLAALGRVDDPKLADVLLSRYPQLAPELRPLAIDLLMQREIWARKVLKAVLEKKLPAGALNSSNCSPTFSTPAE